MNVNEAYAVFKSDYPEESVGKSKFASLRPPHVLLSSSMSRNVCCCQQHQNIILILEALHKFDSNFPLYSHKFPLSIVCDSEKDICYNNMCTTCKDAAKFHNLFVLNEIDKDKRITWYQWEKVAEGNGKEYIKKLKKREELMIFTAPFQNLYLHFFGIILLNRNNQLHIVIIRSNFKVIQTQPFFKWILLKIFQLCGKMKCSQHIGTRSKLLFLLLYFGTKFMLISCHSFR